jgi:hypothetical protein
VLCTSTVVGPGSLVKVRIASRSFFSFLDLLYLASPLLCMYWGRREFLVPVEAHGKSALVGRSRPRSVRPDSGICRSATTHGSHHPKPTVWLNLSLRSLPGVDWPSGFVATHGTQCPPELRLLVGDVALCASPLHRPPPLIGSSRFVP